MASLKNSAKAGQRLHRERHQPESRAKYGILEKKKDWKQRTTDYQEKTKKLKQLRRKALDRNPDEFHYHMVRSQVGFDGVHRERSPVSDDESEVQKILGDVRDIQYVKHKLSVEIKKIEKLKASLHLTDLGTSRNTHTIFVDDDEEARNFDPQKHFNTPASLLGRRFNRPTKDTMSQSSVRVDSKESAVAAERERRAQYAELSKRVDRKRQLEIVLQKLQLKKDLALSKGELKPQLEHKGAPEKAAVYKWTYERKK
ncbi:Utp11 protein [Aphelenchoides avenae]|nr:Utp11 protein [Aphelenchus avenae]